jgi:prolipoprotein diacylglyceryltransferase
MRLDRCANLTVGRRRRVGSYAALGVAGFVAAAVLAMVVSPALGGSPRLVALVAAVAAVTFLGAVKVTDVLFGEERIVFYEQALLVVGACAFALWVAGFPVAAGTDVVVLGLGLFLVFGRVGCFMVGCCHGRPSRRGMCYGPAHADAGFPRRWVGRPLLPVQLLEAGSSLALVVGALTWAALGEPAPGDLTFFYLTGYGLARFGLELMRGDEARATWRGVTEAQLTALAVAWSLVALREENFAAWAAAIALSLATLCVLAHRRLRPFATCWLRSPWHIHEIEALLAAWRSGHGSGCVPRVATTGLGLRVSLQRMGGGGEIEWDLLFSFPGRALAADAIAALMDDLGLARELRALPIVRAGLNAGLVHVLLPEKLPDVPLGA